MRTLSFREGSDWSQVPDPTWQIQDWQESAPVPHVETMPTPEHNFQHWQSPHPQYLCPSWVKPTHSRGCSPVADLEMCPTPARILANSLAGHVSCTDPGSTTTDCGPHLVLTLGSSRPPALPAGSAQSQRSPETLRSCLQKQPQVPLTRRHSSSGRQVLSHLFSKVAGSGMRHGGRRSGRIAGWTWGHQGLPYHSTEDLPCLARVAPHLVEAISLKLEIPNSQSGGVRTLELPSWCFYYRAGAIPRTFHALTLSVHV